MDQFPDISMPPDVKEDLNIIETEDLKSDPFVRAKPIKPSAPVAEAPKPKRAVSEKQKAHLANARKLAREKKAQKKKEEEAKKQDIKEYAQPLEMDHKDTKTDMGTGYSAVKEPPVSVNVAKDGFEEFLGYMDKYSDMMLKLKQEEQAKRLEEERKEKELEAKYFKKFQEMQKSQTPEPKKSIPKKNLDILKAPKNQYGISDDPNDFGQYSNYF